MTNEQISEISSTLSYIGNCLFALMFAVALGSGAIFFMLWGLDGDLNRRMENISGAIQKNPNQTSATTPSDVEQNH